MLAAVGGGSLRVGDLAQASSLEFRGARVAAGNDWAGGKGELTAVVLSLGGCETTSAGALDLLIAEFTELCCGFDWG